MLALVTTRHAPFLFLFSILFVSACHGQENPADRIAWLSSVPAALRHAGQMQRPIIVFVTSAHCGYCRKMELESWTEPDVVYQVTTRFIPLRIKAENEPLLLDHLQVEALPTTLVFTPQGDGVHSVSGFLAAPQLLELLRHAGLQHEQR